MPDTYAMPTGPRGFAECRVHDGSQDLWAAGAHRQVTHLVQLDARGSNGGRPTVCGKTRFARRDPDTHAVLAEADLPGWSMGGGVSGPGVEQVACPECFTTAGTLAPLP